MNSHDALIALIRERVLPWMEEVAGSYPMDYFPSTQEELDQDVKLINDLRAALGLEPWSRDR